jgi:CheY-like chemotaxis protein
MLPRAKGRRPDSRPAQAEPATQGKPYGHGRTRRHCQTQELSSAPLCGKMIRHCGSASVTSPPPSTNGTPSILIVDDEVNLAAELADAAEDEGYVVHTANSAAAAMAILAEHPEIGVMVSDIRMPDCDGLQLTRRVLEGRDETQALEVILITGHATLDDAVLAVRSGAFDFVRKPFRLQQIFDAIARALGRAIGRRRVGAALLALEAQRNGEARTTPEALAASPVDGNPDILIGLMHELRTPLVPILGFAEVLETQRCSPADTVEYARLISQGGRQLLGTVDDLVLLGQIEMGAVNFAPYLFAASVLLQGLSQAHEASAARTGKSLQLHLAEDFHMHADGALLLRALDVLLRVTLEAAPRGAVVTLSAFPDLRGWLISFGTDSAPFEARRMTPSSFAENVAQQMAPLGTRFARAVLKLHGGEVILSGDPQTGFGATIRLPNAMG